MTTYISSESVREILSHYFFKKAIPLSELFTKIENLPSLPIEQDKTQQIKKLIEKKSKMCELQAGGSERHFGGMVCCKQLLSEINQL